MGRFWVENAVPRGGRFPQVKKRTTVVPISWNEAQTMILRPLMVASRVERRVDLEADPDRRRVLSWLLRRHLERHIFSFTPVGLEREDRKNAKRAYFVGEGPEPRVLRYDSVLRRNIRREVVKRRADGEKAWFENEGFGYEVKALGDTWAVRIKPFYMFTGSDARTPLPSFTRTARATRTRPRR